MVARSRPILGETEKVCARVMLLWVIFAVLTSGVLIFILAPLTKRSERAGSHGEANIAVYKAQLTEIDADLQRGTLGATEAEGAKIEVSRRLLASAGNTFDGADGAEFQPKSQTRWRTTSIGVAAIVPALALVFYMAYGSPGQVAKPHAARLQAPAGLQRVTELIGQVEARLREHPEDGTGWDVLAPVYMRQKRFGQAAEAYSRAIRLLGETPARLGGLARASIFANNGIVGDVSRQAWQKVLAAQPKDHEARFWLAVGKEQNGDQAEAKAAYLALLKGAPPNAPWRAVVVSRLKALGVSVPRVATAAKPGESPKTRGPTRADVRAAGQMSPEDRQRMIEGMVAGLASRLKTNGKDIAGWLRLVNAYVVLGHKDRASAAVADARTALVDDPAALEKLDAQARKLGLKP